MKKMLSVSIKRFTPALLISFIYYIYNPLDEYSCMLYNVQCLTPDRTNITVHTVRKAWLYTIKVQAVALLLTWKSYKSLIGPGIIWDTPVNYAYRDKTRSIIQVYDMPWILIHRFLPTNNLVLFEQRLDAMDVWQCI